MRGRNAARSALSSSSASTPYVAASCAAPVRSSRCSRYSSRTASGSSRLGAAFSALRREAARAAADSSACRGSPGPQRRVHLHWRFNGRACALRSPTVRCVTEPPSRCKMVSSDASLASGCVALEAAAAVDGPESVADGAATARAVATTPAPSVETLPAWRAALQRTAAWAALAAGDHTAPHLPLVLPLPAALRGATTAPPSKHGWRSRPCCGPHADEARRGGLLVRQQLAKMMHR